MRFLLRWSIVACVFKHRKIKLVNMKTITYCTDNIAPLAAVTKQRATPSLDTIPTGHDRENFVQGKEVEETLFLIFLERFSEGIIDDDASLISNFPRLKMKLTENFWRMQHLLRL